METTYNSNFCFFVFLLKAATAAALLMAITFYYKAYYLHQWLDKVDPMRIWYPEKVLGVQYHISTANFWASVVAAMLILNALKSLISNPKKSDILDDEAPTDNN